MEGRIVSICLSARKGTRKAAVAQATIVPNWGILGDGHAGRWHRQVSLLSSEDMAAVRSLIPELKPGDFAENIATEGIDWSLAKVGDRIYIDRNIILEITQIGKECHNGCRIQELTGKCLMPEKGIFARVIRGGIIRKRSLIRVNATGEKTGDRDLKKGGKRFIPPGWMYKSG